MSQPCLPASLFIPWRSPASCCEFTPGQAGRQLSFFDRRPLTLRYNRVMPNPGSLLRPESTALVVIDLQERLLPAIASRESVLANTGKLLRLAKVMNLRTILTTQYRKGLGETVPEIAELAAVDPIDKVSFGCLGDEGFCSALRQEIAPGGTILLAGVEAHVCVMQTALGALRDGYQVHVAADAIGSRSELNACAAPERSFPRPRWPSMSCWATAAGPNSSRCCRI